MEDAMTAPPRDDTQPDVLTVEEAAALLRISRNAAYAAARQWRATNGREGIPCIEIGRTLRIPRAGLDALLHGTDAA
jgi:excisionase family DNA binding protein